MTGLFTLLRKSPAGRFSDKFLFSGHFSEMPGDFRKFLLPLRVHSGLFSGKSHKPGRFSEMPGDFRKHEKKRKHASLSAVCLELTIPIEPRRNFHGFQGPRIETLDRVRLCQKLWYVGCWFGIVGVEHSISAFRFFRPLRHHAATSGFVK